MASSPAAYNNHPLAQMETSDQGDTYITPFSTTFFWPSSRRNPSLSSSPSFSSNSSSNGSFSFPDDSPFSPSTSPLRRFSGVPFSWEQIPGKPKNGVPKKEELSTLSLLPLPPAGNCSNSSSFRKSTSKEVLLDNMIISPRKYYDPSESFREDPFFAALVECSKDDHHLNLGKYWKGSSSNVPTKTLSDRFGFIMYASCKRTCAVSESIVFLPRSRPYNLINRR